MKTVTRAARNILWWWPVLVCYLATP